MTTINLYRYDEDQVCSISPIKRSETDVPYCVRLVVDEGKILTNSDTVTYCIDTHNAAEWNEIDDIDDTEEMT